MLKNISKIKLKKIGVIKKKFQWKHWRFGREGG